MKILRFLLVLSLIGFAFSCTKKVTELIQLDDPIFNPASGTTCFPGQIISITCPEYGATIRYTTDGSEPNEQSTIHDPNTPLTVPNFFPPDCSTVTLKAKAYKEGFDPSNTVESDYTVEYFNTVVTPVFLPNTENITMETDVYIICSTLNAEVHYTLDGSEPTKNSPLYVGAFNLTQTGEVTVRARGYRDNWNPSQIASIVYTVTGR